MFQVNTAQNDNPQSNTHSRNSDETTPEQAEREGLPEQKHAGAVGYGPNFANKSKATLGDKLTGIKEQVIGKLTKNPELVQKGHDKKTGELKKREQDEHETDPFAMDNGNMPTLSPGSTTLDSTGDKNGGATGSPRSNGGLDRGHSFPEKNPHHH